MAYPPQPGYPAPMPYHPGQLDGQAKPSGATAIVAGVLAVLGGLYGLVATFISIAGTAAFSDASTTRNMPSDFVDSFKTIFVISAVMYGIMALTLITGAILLFVRKPVGKWLVTAGCAVNIIGMVVLTIMSSSAVSSIPNINNVRTPSGLIGASVGSALIFGVPAIATLVLALVPPTSRYLNWHPGQGAAYGGQQQYPAQGGYPQSAGFPQAGYPQTPPGGAYGQPQQQWGQQQQQQQQPPQQW